MPKLIELQQKKESLRLEYIDYLKSLLGNDTYKPKTGVTFYEVKSISKNGIIYKGFDKELYPFESFNFEKIELIISELTYALEGNYIYIEVLKK